ncbi:sugar phosphate isomerase/epimerase family protein [Emticicia sp.]|uniref:sugar phosphate isomerase/epimerase family protein n=1 Tax=Emticicia sp. TaxID=1930953 RepID=UPI0037537337
MESSNISRRNLLKSSLTVGAGLVLGVENAIAKPQNAAKHNFTFCLNTSTIRKQKIGLMAEIETAAKAGYDAIEIWINTLEEYAAKGGSLKDVKQKAQDLGITIEDAIGFATWIVDDPNQRAKALDQTKREMGMLAEIGCKRIAAPPFGATNKSGIDLQKAAARYRQMLDLGDEMGVLPQLEMWGFSANLHLFGEALFVASESGHPKAVVLSDVYHLFKGGSDFNALKMLSGECIQMFHVNDYPANLMREKINDSHRVFPGDGVAPLDKIFQILNKKNTPIVLSLEVFNEEYWKMNPLDAAKIGLEKMKVSVAKAVGA